MTQEGENLKKNAYKEAVSRSLSPTEAVGSCPSSHGETGLPFREDKESFCIEGYR